MSGSANERTLERYLGAINRHATGEAMSYLRDDFVLEFGSGPKLGKPAVESALGWDAGTDGRIEWNVTEERANVIVIEGEETNEFLRLLGFEPLPFRSRFTFGDEGRIAHQAHEADWSGMSVDEALEPVVEWARTAAPEKLEEVYPEGRMTYTEAAGRGWVALLRRWAEAEAGRA